MLRAAGASSDEISRFLRVIATVGADDLGRDLTPEVLTTAVAWVRMGIDLDEITTAVLLLCQLDRAKDAGQAVHCLKAVIEVDAKWPNYPALHIYYALVYALVRVGWNPGWACDAVQHHAPFDVAERLRKEGVAEWAIGGAWSRVWNAVERNEVAARAWMDLPGAAEFSGDEIHRLWIHEGARGALFTAAGISSLEHARMTEPISDEKLRMLAALRQAMPRR